jgi:DNA-binding response OmpR family regulator
MRVLLISHNHTVQEMVALALREMGGVELVTARSADHVEPTTYDLILVDDALPLYQESIVLAQTLGVEAIVLLAQGTNAEADRFPQVLRKPFLPSEIRTLTEERQAEIRSHVDGSLPAGDLPAPLPKKKKKKKKKKIQKTNQTEVLDMDEIKAIKSLLEEEGLEIVGEEDLAEKVMQAEGDASLDPQEALAVALRTMRPKKIRKLLKGATVRIEITFPKQQA